ncbi:hypothetical protein XI06_15200 [Bradyrhizobium sp. CCBAU 11434]|uniref:hypothetical protein n=1 Tax=Bradyrhizobium sp. CCBAU 11434 TaxID=1630885 RepID=UPI002306D970|nr:hypothetical protein [Bradyrhizobium sp. CCBAU 11434]MDA9521651.1 hypothetical protein [Bradyrhizobium sp. CCBAU 11434]
MKPPGPATLFKMQYHAQLEVERIEIGQDALVAEGLLKEPDASIVERRDAFAGIVRLLDMIQSDPVILEQLDYRKKFAAKFSAEKAAAAIEAGAGAIEIEADE